MAARILYACDRQGRLGTVTLDDDGQLTGDTRALAGIIASFTRRAGSGQAAFDAMAQFYNGYLWFTPPPTITGQLAGARP